MMRNHFTTAALRQKIEARFHIGASTNERLSVTGEPYVVIGEQVNGLPNIPGTVDEGAEREWAFDEETAYFLALNSFERYVEDRAGTLYWRTAPVLEWNRDHSRCHIYMRCLISNSVEDAVIRNCGYGG